MPDHLREYLRFFRDLGIEEIYLPKSARSRLGAKTQSASSAPSMPHNPEPVIRGDWPVGSAGARTEDGRCAAPASYASQAEGDWITRITLRHANR